MDDGLRIVPLGFLLGSCLLLAAPAAAEAQQSWDLYSVSAARVEEGPRVDGILDDPVWQQGTVIETFVQQEPDEGAPGSERTRVRIVYDASTLYIGVEALDSNPGAVTATEMRYDSDRILEEDNFQVILDTFKDSRSGYMFVTNPLGAKLDQQIFEEGVGARQGSPTSNINRNWDGIWDVSSRRTETGWVTEIAIPMVTLRFPDANAQDWGINLMRNIARKNEQVFWAPIPKAFDIMRVSMAGSLTGMSALNRGSDLRIKPFFVGGARRIDQAGTIDDTYQREIGLDVRYGVTPGLNLDLTVNTDFAQAEVDDEQVNLTRFALFFPEKREFFLENAGQFSVGANTSVSRIADLFFSRRIGILDTGENVPILGGARLTGKVGRNNIAVMDVQTDDLPGQNGENFFVARYSRDVFSRSKVGGIVLNKDEAGGPHLNRTYGADFQFGPHPSFTVNGFVAKTETTGLSGRDMAHYVNATWLDQRWRVYGETAQVQSNFNPEVGFVPRAGIRTTKIHVERNPRPGRFGIRVMSPMYNVTYTTDEQNRLVSRRFHHMIGTRFDNGANLDLRYDRSYERLDAPETLIRNVLVNGVRQNVVLDAGAYNFGQWTFAFDSNQAKRVYWGVQYLPGTFYGGDRVDYVGKVGIRINSRLAAETRYTRNEVDLPTAAFDVDLASLRVDYAISPTMILRTLSQYNSSTDQFSTSARFRYTYRPGSDIYLVYDELRRDPQGLPLYKDRRFLLKFTHLLSR